MKDVTPCQIDARQFRVEGENNITPVKIWRLLLSDFTK